MKICFNLFLTLVFFIQSTSWSFGGTSQVPKQQFEKYVSEYNSLSLEKKVARFRTGLELRPKNDQEFVRKNWGDLVKVEEHTLKATEDGFKVVVRGKEYEVSILAGTRIRVEGHVVDVGPGKLEEAAEVLQEKLFPRTTSVLDLVVSPAYAFIAFGAAGIIIGTIVVSASGFGLVSASLGKLVFWGIMLTGAAMVYYNHTSEKLDHLCTETKWEIDRMKESQEVQELATMKAQVNNVLLNLKASGDCEGLFDENDLDRKRICQYNLKCLQDLRRELDDNNKVMDSSDRTMKKDTVLPTAKDKSKQPQGAAKQ